jgi:hypothetical protein
MVSKFVLSFGFGSECQRLLGECCSLAPISLVYSGELFAPRGFAVRGISLAENPRRRPRGQLAWLLGALLVVSGQPLVLVVDVLWLP